MDYNEIIKNIIGGLGSKENIKSHTNCITRLRVTVIDNSLVDFDYLKMVDGVLGVNVADEEIQLIFGPGKVDKARSAMDSAIGISNDSFEETIKQQKSGVKDKRTSKFQQFMSKFSNIFVPLIPGFIAAGTLAGIAGFMSAIGIENGFVDYINVFNVSLMAYMYVIVGYNATKAFGGSGILGGILAGLFIMSYGGEAPSSGMENFMGFAIDPRGGMLGVLIVTILTAYVEKFFRKNLSWDATDIITTPILTLLTMGAATFVIFMPISHVLFEMMNWMFVHLSTNMFGDAILAGLFLPAVMLGIHQGFVPVYQGLVETLGYNTLFPVLAMAGAGQVGASLALYKVADKDSNLRKNIRGAIIPGFLGIGEPLIYGVTLPRVRPFFTAMAGGAVGGFYIGLLNIFNIQIGLNTVFGSSGLLGTIAMTSNHGVITGMLFYLSALLVAYVAGYFITLAFGTKNVDLS